MAHQPNMNDPFKSDLTNDEMRRQARLDNELQADPELDEAPASGGKIAMFALAIALVLGGVFYGLNNTSVNPNGQTASQNAPASQSTAQTTAPAGMRDVTPRANTEPGTTVGAAPARPIAPPSSAPTGTEVDRSAGPATTTPSTDSTTPSTK
jgi:hypothetical protein